MTLQAEDLRQILSRASTGEILDLHDETFDLSGSVVDHRPEVAGVQLKNFCVLNGVLRLRGARGWALTDGLFDRGNLGLLGGDSWGLRGVDFSGGSSMAQLQIAWDDLFGVKSSPKNWRVEYCTFDGQSLEGPAPGTTEVQNHNVYVHSDIDQYMSGLFSNCTFSRAPYGSNLKLGGTSTFSGFTKGVLVKECLFYQAEGKGVNILLPGYSQANVFQDCSQMMGNNPLTVLHTNGPAIAKFVRCKFTGRQVVNVEYARRTFLWWSWMQWVGYAAQQFDVAPVGKNVEGISWVL